VYACIPKKIIFECVETMTTEQTHLGGRKDFSFSEVRKIPRRGRKKPIRVQLGGNFYLDGEGDADEKGWNVRGRGHALTKFHGHRGRGKRPSRGERGDGDESYQGRKNASSRNLSRSVKGLHKRLRQREAERDF